MCYNKDKWTIYQLLEHFAGQTRRSQNDNSSYTLEEYFDEVGNMYSTNQEAFDDWMKGPIVYEELAQEEYGQDLQNIEQRLREQTYGTVVPPYDEDFDNMDLLEGGKKKKKKKKTKKKKR